MALLKSIACQFGIALIVALSVVLAHVSEANAQAQSVGVLVQVPSTGNDCVAGSCSAHTPLPFGGSFSVPSSRMRIGGA